MKRIAMMLTALCLLLSGCSLMSGEHLSVTPHESPIIGNQSANRSVSDYAELKRVLEAMVQAGTESMVINVAQYNQKLLDNGVKTAVTHVKDNFPLGAWAVEDVEYEIGTGGGQRVISVNISYIHGRSQIRQVQKISDMKELEAQLVEALEECADSVVFLVDAYDRKDLVQMVEDHADTHPNTVMEIPAVAVGVYPDGESGARVVEVNFAYQTSRESLRQMQNQVQRVFSSAELYINSDSTEIQKYSQLYTFLMERFDYTIDTSITPAYSLLVHGVGDSEAFASIYGAMCRQAGLECEVVSGTKNGEAWYWNLIRVDDRWYHVDLLEASAEGAFVCYENEQMQGYVWDYSAYGET